MPARADEDHDRDIDRTREDNDKGIRAEIKVLREQVASLYSTVSALQSQVDTLQTANTVLETRLAAVQKNPALKLGPFVSVDPNTEIGVSGPNITFTGANIHIVSGSGATGDYGNGKALGLGNLIIGYDEDPINYPTGGPGAGFKPLNPGDRAGSHNLVIGSGHRFSSSSGLVAGELNSLGGFGSSVTGGYGNTTGGPVSSVSGGGANIADGTDASVSGGLDNHADANSPASAAANRVFAACELQCKMFLSTWTEDQILEDFPELTCEDINACFAFAADRERKLFVAPP